MKTSIVLVSYNGAGYLDECLASLLQEAGRDDEIIVVDNASGDDSARLVLERWPQVRLFSNRTNRGFAAGCNQGARLASGEVLVFVNQDTRVAPGWLKALAAGLSEGDGVALATSQVLVMSQPERIQACGQEVHYTGLVFGRGFGATAGSLSGAETVGAVTGCSFAVRRDVWQELGGLDEALYMYYEETDLCWRARLRGYRSVCVPCSVVHHDYRPARPDSLRAYYSSRNRRIMLLKNWRSPTLLLLAPGLLLAEVAEWELAVRQGWAGIKAKLRADVWLVCHLSLVTRLHAAAQAGRTVSDAEILGERTRVVHPQELAVGPLGRVSMALGNALFALNHRLAQHLCRLAGL